MTSSQISFSRGDHPDNRTRSRGGTTILYSPIRQRNLMPMERSLCRPNKCNTTGCNRLDSEPHPRIHGSRKADTKNGIETKKGSGDSVPKILYEITKFGKVDPIVPTSPIRAPASPIRVPTSPIRPPTPTNPATEAEPTQTIQLMILQTIQQIQQQSQQAMQQMQQMQEESQQQSRQQSQQQTRMMQQMVEQMTKLTVKQSTPRAPTAT
ncbi:hypothetical protein E4U30_005812 [Claviceps sp. LM220 group G6]|nr:hypothetical protein E4U30_005812 [Claviceps sp. LM220 group G6]